MKPDKLRPPAAPTAPPAHHPSRAGPGGRHCALVRWGRPRAVARGRQGEWAPAVAKAVPEPQAPPSSPSRADCPAAVLAGPCGAGRWPAGSRQGGPAAGVGTSGHALARPAPGGQRGAGGPTPGVGTSGRRGAGGDGRGRVGLREKWLYFSYTPRLPQLLVRQPLRSALSLPSRVYRSLPVAPPLRAAGVCGPSPPAPGVPGSTSPAACVRPAGRTASHPARGWGGVRWPPQPSGCMPDGTVAQ
jgi:hypothetical protein